MSDNRDFDITDEINESEQIDIIIEDEDAQETVDIEEDTETNNQESEPSEFERELENYLPTPENTTKVKQPVPGWVVSVIASCGVCILFLLVYSVLVMPNLRPRAVISYSGASSEKIEFPDESKNPVEKIANSVVTITGTSSYHSFFGISSSKSTGSGIVLSEDGYILTTHSVLGQEGITVTVDGKEYEATVQGVDASKDIAVIKIDKNDLIPAVLGDSDRVQMGEPVVCLGNVLGEEMGTSATRGIVCGVNRDVNINGRNFNLLQTDAETSQGNAGGPVINMAGEIIGMITYAVTAESSEISFAIPANDIKNVAESLITTGAVPKGLVIGFTGSDTDHGVVVESVMEDTPAARAGIKEGDLVLRVDDTEVKSISDINKIRDTHVSGDKLIITLYRDGEVMDIEVTL